MLGELQERKKIMKHVLLALALVCAPITTFAAKEKAAAKPENYKVDASASSAKWEGKKIGGGHHGELQVKGGELTVENGALSGGHVEIDMTSLKNTDVTDAESNGKLVNHLKSDDFFSVDKHPVSSFKITKVETKGAKANITGDLTIKGITKPATFPADLKIENGKLKAKGTLTIDRTLYDIRFRSAKFFENLGDKVIKDNFTVAIDLTASK